MRNGCRIQVVLRYNRRPAGNFNFGGAATGARGARGKDNLPTTAKAKDRQGRYCTVRLGLSRLS